MRYIVTLLLLRLPLSVTVQNDNEGRSFYMLIGGSLYNESFDDAIGSVVGYSLGSG